MAAVPRLSQKGFALKLSACVFNLCKALQVCKSGISIEARSYMCLFSSFQFLILKSQKTGNKGKVVLVHCEIFILNFFSINYRVL